MVTLFSRKAQQRGVDSVTTILPSPSLFFVSSLTNDEKQRRSNKSPPPPSRDYLTRVNKTPLRITPTIDRFDSKEGGGEGGRQSRERNENKAEEGPVFFASPSFSYSTTFPPPCLPPSLEGGVRARNTRPRVSLSSHSRGNKRGAYGSRHILRPHFYFDTNSHVVSTASMTRVRPIVLIPTRYCPYKSPETRAQDVSSAPRTHTHAHERHVCTNRSVATSLPLLREGKERSRIQYGVWRLMLS